MHLHSLVLAAALSALSFLSIASAQAQLLDDATAHAPRLGAEGGGRFGPLAEGFKRYEPLYGGDEGARAGSSQFSGFRTDPRLVLGYAFTKNFAIEAGYSYLRDQGFHKIDPGPAEAAATAGALGAKSHTTYVAAKLSVPLGERLSAYGKFGIAHSQVKNDGLLPAGATAGGEPLGTSGRGAYGAIGAKLKVNERTTISAEARSNGSASKFEPVSNASSLRGSVGIGF